MTIQEFKTAHGIEKISLYFIDNHVYAEPLSVKLDINKDILPDDIKDKDRFRIIPFLDGFVMTKAENIAPYGLKIEGHWNEGFALDLHTTKSTLTGTDAGGNNQYSSLRTPIAEDLYKLKYGRDRQRVENIAKHTSWYLNTLTHWKIHKIIPIPPSDTARSFQPVVELAKTIGILTKLEVDFGVVKKLKSTSQLKSINDPTQRKEVLKDAFDTNENSLAGKNVLLFDDLFRSGETLNATYDILKNKGKAESVYVLTITKTRSKR